MNIKQIIETRLKQLTPINFENTLNDLTYNKYNIAKTQELIICNQIQNVLPEFNVEPTTNENAKYNFKYDSEYGDIIIKDKTGTPCYYIDVKTSDRNHPYYYGTISCLSIFNFCKDLSVDKVYLSACVSGYKPYLWLDPGKILQAINDGSLKIRNTIRKHNRFCKFNDNLIVDENDYIKSFDIDTKKFFKF